MAACKSLHHIFENPLPPDSSPLLDSLSSWNQLNSLNSIHHQLFQSNSPSDSTFSKQYTKNSINGDNFSPRNCESLQLCTEGLGFESFDDVEDLKNEDRNKQNQDDRTSSISYRNNNINIPAPENQGKKLRSGGGSGGGGFPPPISCIGKSGKPCVSFKSYRQDGRFVLKQVRMASQEFLHAHREDGRLKLRFIQPSDEIVEEEEDEEDEEEESVKDENEEETSS